MRTVFLLLVLAAQATTTTAEEVPRMVGDPLPTWQLVGASVALLLVILVAGAMVSRRMRSRE